MRKYSYEPLESDEIRLLELFAGDHNSELHGSLDKFRLPENEEPSSGQHLVITRDGVEIQNAPAYRALSYTWGHDAEASQYLRVLQNREYCYLPMKPNLRDALLRLRSDIPSGQSIRVWIDALCIDQINIPEKNSQIRKMAMIYHSAERVCVWLGNESKDDCRAIEFIHKLLRLEDFDPLTQDPGTPVEWAALNSLMRRPWFNRRWIIQEISLARKATLFCGTQSVSWQDFSSAVALFFSRSRDLRTLFQSSEQFHNHPDYLGEVDALGAKALVDITSNLFRKSEDGFILERLFSLEALISTMTLFESSSPHDTIYSVLWLAHDAEPDSKDTAAMSYEANIRTPRMSPTMDFAPSDGSDSPVFPNSPEQVLYTASPISELPTGPLPTAPLKSPLLEPPKMHTKRSIARSATELSLGQAETQFDAQRSHSFMVDYNQNTFPVFQQFLDYTICRSLSIDIICHPWAPEPAEGEPDLPSWIPQLSSAPFEKEPGTNTYSRVRADSLVGRPGFGTKHYNASGKTKMYPETDFIRDRTLVVTGFPLDSIKSIDTPALQGVIPYTWMDYVGWNGPPEPVPERFWRTLVADRGIGGQNYAPAYFPLACKYVFERRSKRANVDTSKLLTHGKCPSIVTEFLRRVQCVVWGRRLALTKGHDGSQPLIALVPQEARDGDIICILHGCSVPVVLRREAGKKRQSEETTFPRRKSSRLEASDSEASTFPGLTPQISLTEAFSTTSMQRENSPERKRLQARGLTVRTDLPDVSFASTGVRKAFNPVPLEANPPKLPINLESGKRYTFIGECYVHGMMAGEAFKYRMDHRIARKAFHLV